MLRGLLRVLSLSTALLCGDATWAQAAQPSSGDVDTAASTVAACFDRLLHAERASSDAADARAELLDLPRAVLFAHLRALAAGDPDLATRATALDLVARIGSTEEIALLLDLARSGAAAEPLKRIAPSFDEALDRVLVTDPRTLTVVQQRFVDVGPALRVTLVRAVARTRWEARAEVLARLIGSDPDVDAALLMELSRLPTSLLQAGGERVLGAALDALQRPDPIVAQAAARVLGELDDVGAVPALVEALGREGGYPRSGACEALGKILRLQLGDRPEAWRAWIRDEEAWWRREGADTTRALAAGNGAERVRAILQLSAHPLHRAELLDGLERGLRSWDPGAIALGCQAVAQTGAVEGQRVLELCLDHCDEGVRRAAAAALASLDVGGGETSERPRR